MFAVSKGIKHQWVRYGPRKLPDMVSTHLGKRYSYVPEYLDTLRCFVQLTSINGRLTNHILIFDPYRAKLRHHVIVDRSDLEQTPEIVAFEGYYDKSGLTSITDRRRFTYR